MPNSILESHAARGQSAFKTKAKPNKAKVDKTAVRSPIRVSEHGRYQIKSGLLAGTFVARAFAKPPTQARGMIAEASGATEDAAITALQDVIDARETRQIQSRRTDPDTKLSVPSVEEYTEALGHVALTRPQQAILKALSVAGAEGLTDLEMTNGSGYKSVASANKSLASAGRLIAKYLSFQTPSKMPSAVLEGSSVVAFRGPPPDEKDPGNWTLHPELCDAVKATL